MALAMSILLIAALLMMPLCAIWNLLAKLLRRFAQEVRDQYAAIPWRMMIATRNKLIHGCLGIDTDTLWSIIQSDVPELLNQLQKIR